MKMDKRSVTHDLINGRTEHSKLKHVTESLCPPADVCQTATGRSRSGSTANSVASS